MTIRLNPTTLAGAALLAIVGAGAALPAQDRSPRRAIERDDARRSVRTLISRMDDDPDRPRLGLTVVAGSASDTLGILVDGITAGGPAEKAGLQKGDRLVAIEGVSLRLDPADADDAAMQGVVMRRLTRELARHKVGDAVTLRYARDGRTREASVTTVAADTVRATVTWAGASRRSGDRASLGVALGGATGVRDTAGIFVTRVARGGPAERAGVVEGDRLASIDGVDLRVPREDVDDAAVATARVRRLQRELDKRAAGDTVELRVVRNGQPRTLRVATVAAREVEDARGASIIIGDGSAFPGFDVSIAPPPPAPPIPPGAPKPPVPDSPALYFFDRDGDGPIRFRMSTPFRTERDDLPDRAREALERALELAPRAGQRMRIDLEAPDGELRSAPRSLERIRPRLQRRDMDVGGASPPASAPVASGAGHWREA